MDILSPGYKFRRGTGSPFDALPNSEFGQASGTPCQWCHFCQQSCDVEIVRPNQAEVYGYKQTCKRCGNVTASAVYYQITDISTAPIDLYTKAIEWMNEPSNT
jgi:heterodisulfide reductase subunit A-like polyferredoxin